MPQAREADPRKLIEAIEDFGVTNMFGSPALLDTLSRYGEREGVKLTSLKRVISAGAPVHATIIERVLGMLPDDARLHTPYGATESLPVASIDSDTLLGETRALTNQGRGVCVGRPVPEAEVRVIRITDAPIARWSDDLVLPQGEVGEIVVKSPMVTHAYMNRPDHTALAKIREGEGRTRRCVIEWGTSATTMRGAASFLRTEVHRVRTADGDRFVPAEVLFNAHDAVFRTALVGVGRRGASSPSWWWSWRPACPPSASPDP